MVKLSFSLTHFCDNMVRCNTGRSIVIWLLHAWSKILSSHFAEQNGHLLQHALVSKGMQGMPRIKFFSSFSWTCSKKQKAVNVNSISSHILFLILWSKSGGCTYPTHEPVTILSMHFLHSISNPTSQHSSRKDSSRSAEKYQHINYNHDLGRPEEICIICACMSLQ